MDKIYSLLSSIYFVIICLAMLSAGIYMISTLTVDGEFTGFLVYALSPVLILFGIYGILRIWNNRNYIRIATGLEQAKNRQLLIKFLENRNYQIATDSGKTILVIDEQEMSFNGLWTKHIRFQITDNFILFNIQKHYPSVNPPVFFSHLFLKHDLKTFISKQNHDQ